MYIVMGYEVFTIGCLQLCSNVKKLRYAAVCIDPVMPSWFKGFHFPDLAPPKDLLLAKQHEIIDNEIFVMLFMKYLRSLDARETIRKLRRFAPDSDLVALLSGTKFDFDNHRFLVAKWLTANGYPTEESKENYLKSYKQVSLF